MNIVEQIMHSTVRILTFSRYGEGSGTGFFFKFLPREDGVFYSAIVTNRHVLENVDMVKLVVTRINDMDIGDLTNHVTLEISDVQKCVVYHPDDNVDLALIPTGGFIEELIHSGRKIFSPHLDASFILDEEYLDSMQPIENVSVVGYPNGLWDAKNNLPLVRSGRTASDLRKDFNGNKEFIIDCAIYPGSSGSPVFLMDIGSYYHNGGVMVGERVALLGVNVAVFLNSTVGTIIPESIETLSGNVATSIPNNLGIVIKAERILEFETVISLDI